MAVRSRASTCTLPLCLQVGLLQGHTDRVYCLALGLVRQRQQQPGGQQLAQQQQQVQQQKPQQAQRQSPLLQLVASGSLDGSVRLWELSSGEQLQQLTPGGWVGGWV